jgi:chromosome segregation ATPase
MARLSGLASEHHPVGPGDAPRRKKGRKHSPSVDLAPASKRAASPSLDSSQPRRKRVQIDEHEQLTREMDDSVSRTQTHVTKTTTVAEGSTRRSGRRHSEPAVAAADENDSQITPPPPSTQPAPGLTPHLNRIGAPHGRPSNARRARMSMPPQIDVEAGETNGDNQVQYAPYRAILDGRTRRRLRRSHISEEINDIEDHNKEDRKMRQEYAELRRQLRAKDKAIKDLEFQLEAGRMGNIAMPDGRAEELEKQLTHARDEIADLRASSAYMGESREPSAFEDNDRAMNEDDEEGLLLIDPNDPEGPQELSEDEFLPNGEYATRVMALSSQVTVQSLGNMSQTTNDVLAEASQADSSALPDKISDKAVKRYEAEIEHLVQQLADSQGALRVIAIELQNLHILQPGASSEVIISELRHCFEAVREELENLIPGVTKGLTNSELLHKIPQLFEGVLTELQQKVVSSETYHQKSRKLQVQFEHVLDLLARSDAHNKELEEQNAHLDNQNALKDENILNLDERVATLSKLVDTQDTQISQQMAEINGLKDEVQDKDTSLARLRASIEEYRLDLNKVTVATTNLEEEHRVAIENMEQAHAETVQGLTMELEEQSEARDKAEGEAAQKTEYIEELEANVTRIEEQVDTITDELTSLRQLLADETELRQTVEGQRDSQTSLAYEQANTIENLNEQIQDLETKLNTFRANLETERSQRAQTETALDEANNEITDLQASLHNAGIQANELRSKLFQVQQEKAQAIADLEEAAEEREAQHQSLLGNEIQLHQAAEQQVVNLEAQVTQLLANIATLEDNIAQMTLDRNELEKDRDTRVVSLNTQLADLKQKYAALESSSTSTITTLQANITDLTNQGNAQQIEMERLIAEAAETERILNEDLEDKTVQIVELKTELNSAQSQNQSLTNEVDSLSIRVGEEAMELLRIEEAHEKERTALRQVIETQKETIATLQNTAAQRAIEHEQVIAEKTLDIEGLQMMGEARAEAIVGLEAQIAELKEAFRVAEEDTRLTIDTLTESYRLLQQQNETLAAGLQQRNADALKAVQEMKVKGVEVRTQGVEMNKVANGRITKVSERVKIGKKGGGKKKVTKRQWDSGFGVDENIENDIDGLGAEEPIMG